MSKIQCQRCKDVVESKTRHDFQTCSCGSSSVDGGQDYTRVLWRDEVDPPVIIEEGT